MTIELRIQVPSFKKTSRMNLAGGVEDGYSSSADNGHDVERVIVLPHFYTQLVSASFLHSRPRSSSDAMTLEDDVRCVCDAEDAVRCVCDALRGCCEMWL